MGNFEREHLKSSRDQQQLGCHIIAPVRGFNRAVIEVDVYFLV